MLKRIHLRKRLIGDFYAVVVTGPTGWRHQQSEVEDRLKIVHLLAFIHGYYVCLDTLGNTKYVFILNKSFAL